MKELKVGDKVWYVSTRGSQLEPEVTAVGRKWVTVGGHTRMDKKTWEVEKGFTGTPQGTVWESLEAYNERKKVVEAWNGFVREVSRIYPVPAWVTLETVDRLRTITNLMEKK